MLKPLVLGKRVFPINLIQGPLAGVSCAPFRVLTSRYSRPAYACTEMISCKTLIHQSIDSRRRLVLKDSEEGPLCFQLAGNDPAELAEATKIVTELGADMVDLNCGCPVKKIRRKGAGSSLLADSLKLYQLIYAMKQSTPLPISIKIRVDGEGEENNREIAKVVSEAGADCLIVHGRHWTEHYETPCRLDAIEYFVQTLKIPVIGNGDVACEDSLRKMFSTGCAGVMVGRAGVGQPWLIRNLIARLNNEPPFVPDLAEIGFVFLEHVLGLVKLLGSEKFSILQARKFAKYYARPLRERTEFCAAVNLCESLSELKSITLKYFS